MKATLDDGLTGFTFLGDADQARKLVPTARNLLKFAKDNWLFDRAKVGRWRWQLPDGSEIDGMTNHDVDRIIIRAGANVPELPYRVECTIFQEPGYVEWPDIATGEPGPWHLIEPGPEDRLSSPHGWYGRLNIVQEADTQEDAEAGRIRVSYAWLDQVENPTADDLPHPDDWPAEGVDSQTSSTNKKLLALYTNIQFSNGKLKQLIQAKLAVVEVWKPIYVIVSFLSPNKAPAAWVHRDENLNYWLMVYNAEGTNFAAYTIALSPCGEHLRELIRTEQIPDDEFTESYILADADIPAALVDETLLDLLLILVDSLQALPGDLRQAAIQQFLDIIQATGNFGLDVTQQIPVETVFGDGVQDVVGSSFENGIMWNWHGTRGDIVTYEHVFNAPANPAQIKWQTMRHYSYTVAGLGIDADPFTVTIDKLEEQNVTFRVGIDLIWFRHPIDDLQQVFVPVTSSGLQYPAIIDTPEDGVPIYCHWRRRHEGEESDPAVEDLVMIRYYRKNDGNTYDDTAFNARNQTQICEWEGFVQNRLEQYASQITAGFFETIVEGEEPTERDLVDERIGGGTNGRFFDYSGTAVLTGVNEGIAESQTPWSYYNLSITFSCTLELAQCAAPNRIHKGFGESTQIICLGGSTRIADEFILFPFNSGEACYLGVRSKINTGVTSEFYNETTSANSAVFQTQGGGDDARCRFLISGSSSNYPAASVVPVGSDSYDDRVTMDVRLYLFGRRYMRVALDDTATDDEFFDGSFAEFFDPSLFVDVFADQRFFADEGIQGESMYTYDLRVPAPDPKYAVSNERIPFANFNGFWQGHN